MRAARRLKGGFAPLGPTRCERAKFPRTFKAVSQFSLIHKPRRFGSHMSVRYRPEPGRVIPIFGQSWGGARGAQPPLR
jgi:hypothetical protein